MTGPLRIKTLTLCDYRAFPGPAPMDFDLGGRNLLVYGENGAGKSSIFHALADFFSTTRRYTLRERKNVFSDAPEAACRVEVGFNDGGAPAAWSFDANGEESHPARVGGDRRVIGAARWRACLDYRALLDTNYAQGHGRVNLFEIARERLLADFPALLEGKELSIEELWAAVETARPKRQGKTALARVNLACARFNEGFRQALDALHPMLKSLLSELTGIDVTVTVFLFGGLTWDRKQRALAGRTLGLEVLYRAHPLATPQHFLNEARLSALGLAIYLAGRLASVPGGEINALKLLVLDDVLIGLDHENRGPLLDVIRDFFPDWQVVLLTHDLYWFDMARDAVTPGAWHFAEVFDGLDAARDIPMPTFRSERESGAVETALNRAEQLLHEHHLGDAANRVRVGWEYMLRGFCERNGVPVAFKRVARSVNTEALRVGIKRWAEEKPDRAALLVPLEETFHHRRVLNDGSHDPLPGMVTRDVERAITAVRALDTAFEQFTNRR